MTQYNRTLEEITFYNPYTISTGSYRTANMRNLII